ncbi:hypothetical protein Tco_1516389 [Tanacetum coccineum]
MKKKKLSHGASTSGLRGSKKLKPGALSLYVGDGHRVAVEAIGTYHLELPSGLVIVLNNYKLLYKSLRDMPLETAAPFFNMVPTKKVDKTPYEIWHGQAPKLSYLRVWGCEAFVKHDTLPNYKLEPNSYKCILRRIPQRNKGYSFYNPSENKVFAATEC